MMHRNHMTAKERKGHPIFSGVLQYFPDALMEVAELSKIGNDQHNPGEPLHWAKGKSMDQEDALVRHLLDKGLRDTDGVRHSAKVAWRALAMLQLEIEREEELFISEVDYPATATPALHDDFDIEVMRQVEHGNDSESDGEVPHHSLEYRYTHEDRPVPRLMPLTR